MTVRSTRLLLSFVCLLPAGAQASSFTPEQRAEIQAMIEAMREDVRAEIRAEFEGERQNDPLSAVTRLEPQIDGAQGPSEQSPAQPAAVEEETVPIALATERFLGPAAAAPMEHVGTSARSGFQLTAGTDTQRASLKVGRERSYREPDDEIAIFDSVALIASAPLAKPDTGLNNIATLDGFVNAAELSLTFSQWRVGGLRNPFGDEALIDRICLVAGIKLDEQCDDNLVKTGLTKAGRLDLYPAYRSAFWDPQPQRRWTWGGQLRVGEESFDYFNADLTKGRDSEIPWGVKAYFGFIPRGMPAFVAFGAEWQRSYQAIPPATACANSTNPVLSCVTGSLGPPREKTKHLLSIEARRELGDYAVALKATHDLKNDESGVDLPIYLFRNEAGQFSGGVRAGWTSTDAFSFGVFVGTPFNILK
jgi:hypothetical protein